MKDSHTCSTLQPPNIDLVMSVCTILTSKVSKSILACAYILQILEQRRQLLPSYKRFLFLSKVHTTACKNSKSMMHTFLDVIMEALQRIVHWQSFTAQPISIRSVLHCISHWITHLVLYVQHMCRSVYTSVGLVCRWMYDINNQHQQWYKEHTPGYQNCYLVILIFDRYVKVKESLYIQFIICVNTILKHIDAKSDFN
jgi:hypothetical protein